MPPPLNLEASQPDEKLNGIIKLAILAVGGQGGGVLTNWIETVARSENYACQATAVAGVAQRTGATIYYIEMAPAGEHPPVFSLAPAPGDVDIMIASEMMEAGRAILRGFVTPDRTTLIGSTHRALAVSEKMVPGNGIASSEEVHAVAEIAAQKLIMFDMEALALENGSVISSALFGALAASATLPFSRTAFENAIRSSGKGVESSLRAFSAAFDRATNNKGEAPKLVSAPLKVGVEVKGPPKLMAGWAALMKRVERFPPAVHEMAQHGLRKVVSFQDLVYGGEYLDRLEALIELDSQEKGYIFSIEAAKYIANAMAYDDVIRVADLKTLGSRFARIEKEMGAKDKTLKLTEFMHPTANEIVGLLPARIGRRIENSPTWMKRLDRWFNKGRRTHTHRFSGFLPLYFLGGLRGYRRRTLRHKYEQEHLNDWLDRCLSVVKDNYDYAVELLRCRRLVKGYSDTHKRGLSKFDKVLKAAQQVQHRDDAGQWVARLREAALQDEKGTLLDGAIKTIHSFTTET